MDWRRDGLGFALCSLLKKRWTKSPLKIPLRYSGWVEEVKRINDKVSLHHNDTIHKVEARSTTQNSAHHFQHDGVLTKPSCCANVPSSSSGQNKHTNPPAMANEEQHLLKENRDCLNANHPYELFSTQLLLP